MEKFLKENLIYILIVIIIAGGGIYGVYHFSSLAFEDYANLSQKKELLLSKQQKYEQLVKASEEAKRIKPESKSGKKIYEVLGQQFSSEASFGIMFENILSNITSSGIRVRSIDYNYQLTDDKIMIANLPGYNACELSFYTVGTYAQMQTFFRNLAKESYLTNISEIYLEPYDLDKTILISKFKIRLYTKTI